MTTESSTAISRRRRPRGRYPKTQDGATPKRPKRIPEYLEADEVNAIIRAAPNPKAKLLMLEQWRAGLRVSEALDLEVRDLSLDTPNPTIRVRSGKGGKSRLMPVHPELHGALSSALAYGDISQGRIVEAHPATAWRWVQAAVKRAEELGAIAPGKASRHPHAAPQLCPAPADERHSNQLLIALVRALVDTNYAHLLRARAGPDGQSGGCAVKRRQMSVTSLSDKQKLTRCLQPSVSKWRAGCSESVLGQQVSARRVGHNLALKRHRSRASQRFAVVRGRQGDIPAYERVRA